MADDATLNFLKKMLDYTEAQWETWKNNQRNLKTYKRCFGDGIFFQGPDCKCEFPRVAR